jgi:hypothetical protein
MMQSGVQHVLAMILTLLAARGAWAACNIGSQLSRLDASAAKCTQRQLHRLDTILSNRLQFRESLDLPLATKAVRERKCPSADEFEAFIDEWKRLPGTGFNYAVKRYCLTPPTYYGIRFLWPDKPLDDTAATRLSTDIDALRNDMIPALTSKHAEVETLVR